MPKIKIIKAPVKQFKKGGNFVDPTSNTNLNPTRNTGMPSYNPYVYFRNSNWYMSTNPQSPEITQSMKPVDEEVANIEAEKGELLVKPGLMGLYNVQGKKHSQGGTPLFAEGGSFIFSNDPKLSISKHEREAFGFKKGGSTSKSKNTPAKVLNREVKAKDYNSHISVLQDGGSDKIAKTTAALMLQKMQAKIGQVAYLQEVKKNKPVPDFAMGSAPIRKDQFHDIDEKMAEYRKGGMTYPYGGETDPTDPPWKKALDQWNQNMGSISYPANLTNNRSSRNFGVPGSVTGGPKRPGAADQSIDWASKARSSMQNPNDIWRGDQYATPNPRTGASSNTWNAMTDYDTTRDYANAVGYTGDNLDPKSIQQWVMQNYPDLVAKYHGSPSQGGYGMPNAGKPDDQDLGIRWQDIANEISKGHTPNQSNPYQPVTQSTGPNVQAPNLPPGAPQTQPFDATPSLPYDIKGKLTANQISDLGRIGLQSLNINRYYPKRSQVNLPDVRLDTINPQPMVNAINNQSFNAFNSANLNPRTASLVSSNIRGQSADQISQVLGTVANQNVQIGNQQNLTNLQQRTNQVMANASMDQDYYNKVQTTNQNFDDEKRFANNQFFSTLNQYRSQDDALAWQLAAQSRYGNRKVVDPKTGKVYNQPTPLFEQTPGGIRYNADVANVNMAPRGSKIDTPREIAEAWRTFYEATGDKTIAQRLMNQMIRSRGVKGAQSQGPFNTQDPY